MTMQFWDFLALIGSGLALAALIWILILDARDARRSSRVWIENDDSLPSITSVIGKKEGRK
ncbi:hypothetical protein OS128_05280 [Corynebacterium sp. P5848]|uniref:hypothetical protein n=1 Tax=Corynebacterium marambiense TaxID=2765364 RepID=UPI0022609214|nr:hypothetical protein [Corynebacterium marambiense]MCX7542323.1 hypothetical protein [Corynebacterium marambiense]